MRTLFKNGQIIFPTCIKPGSILVENNKIIDVLFDENKYENARKIDCQGYYISPGFIDIHLHGGGGADAMDGNYEAINKITTTHAKYGTTSMVLATMSGEQENVIKAIQAIQNAKDVGVDGATVLGVHLESYFFSMQQKGAQNPKYILPPTLKNYEDLINCAKDILIISAAPELENGLEFAKEMKKRGIVMSVAHSDATYEEFNKAVEAGYNHVTHIFNGNSYIHDLYYYCKIGVCETALLYDDVYVEVIADGKHLPPELLRLIYKIKGADKVNLCTDAMMATDMSKGSYNLGGLDVMIEDDVAMLTDRSSFAGSVCTTNRAVRTMYKLAGVSLNDAVKMITATPAKIINIYDKKGSMTEGKDADIIVFNDNIDIKYSMINGKEFLNNLNK